MGGEEFIINQLTLLGAALGLSFAAGAAVAAVSAETAAQLGAALTPMGAERHGNTSGTIAPWTGGITESVPGYRRGDHHPDPFAADKPLFEISARNLVQYADQIPQGLQQLLKQNPDYSMRVFPTFSAAALRREGR